MEVQLVCERRVVLRGQVGAAKVRMCAISCEQYRDMRAYALAIMIAQRFGRPTPSRQALLEGFVEADLMAIPV